MPSGLSAAVACRDVCSGNSAVRWSVASCRGSSASVPDSKTVLRQSESKAGNF